MTGKQHELFADIINNISEIKKKESSSTYSGKKALKIQLPTTMNNLRRR